MPRGNLSGANPAPYTTTFAYDNANHLQRKTSPNGNMTQYVFDDLGNETSTTDGDGQTTTVAASSACRRSRTDWRMASRPRPARA